MSGYLEIIKTALILFPFVAFLISLPFLLSQYHKYGAITFWKTLIIYSFALYLTCAYFLVILPLPDPAEVAAMTSPRTQLIPGQFIADFFSHTCLNLSQPATYLPALTQSYFYVPIYNLLLTLPFGLYLHYYFKFSLKKTVFASFLLSLFFELTQLTGLYFIYPRGYRLFDVDDLILNTLGGLLGYLAATPLLKILPTREQIDLSARERGQTVSGLRRTLAFGFDFILFSLLASVLGSCFSSTFAAIVTFIIYYLAIPLALRGSTLIQKFLQLKIVDQDGQFSSARLTLNRLVLAAIYFILPSACFALLRLLPNPENVLLLAFTAFFYLIFCAVLLLRILFTTKPLPHERLSRTKLVSTVQPYSML